jgi:phage shock protein PspC (stress-responsive transcriptional regulator)
MKEKTAESQAVKRHKKSNGVCMGIGQSFGVRLLVHG